MNNKETHAKKTNTSNESKTLSGDLSYIKENVTVYYTFEEIDNLFRSKIFI